MKISILFFSFLFSLPCLSMENPEIDLFIRNVMTIDIATLDSLKFLNDPYKDVIGELYEALSGKVKISYKGEKQLTNKIVVLSNFELKQPFPSIPFALVEEENNKLALSIDIRQLENHCNELFKGALGAYGTVQQLEEKILEAESRLEEVEGQIELHSILLEETAIHNSLEKEAQQLKEEILESTSTLEEIKKQISQQSKIAEESTKYQNNIVQNTKKPNGKTHHSAYRNFLNNYPYFGHLTAVCVGIAGTLLWNKISYATCIDLAKKIKLFH
jgi:hypothetical protein